MAPLLRQNLKVIAVQRPNYPKNFASTACDLKFKLRCISCGVTHLILIASSTLHEFGKNFGLLLSNTQ